MPTYICLGKWTKDGIQKVKESPARLDAGRKAFESGGVKLKDFYMVMGQYDIVMVIEAPDDAALATANLTLASQGFVHTETLKAFPESDYRKIIGGLK